ncbi:MAG: cobalamin-binding protein [Pseudomonadota bacterium]|nr:cobalamin-binding protein [Pseudomonadota bacterium]
MIGIPAVAARAAAAALFAASFGLCSAMYGPVRAASARPAARIAPRIVSLSPHITELLFAAGAGPRIVGVDDASDYPPAVMRIPRVGEAAALDIEGLLRLQPTLVLVWGSGSPPQLRSQLERLHVSVGETEQRTLEDIGSAIVAFGRLGDSAPAAEEAARRYRSDLAALRSQYAHRPRLKVFYQVWDRPLYTLSGAHVVSEALSLCGGDNIFAHLSTLAPAVDREAVIAADPDVILIGATGPEGARQAADWSPFSDLRAVRAHRIFMLDASLIGRMSPRILQGIREVCSSLDAARAGTVSNKRQPPG